MKISEIAGLIGADVLTGSDKLDREMYAACGSDLMSDVLAFIKDQAVLLTGLLNTQVIRTAEMMDTRCVIFVRGKIPSNDIIKLAEENGIVVMTTPMRMYVACGKLYEAGLRGDGE